MFHTWGTSASSLQVLCVSSNKHQGLQSPWRSVSEPQSSNLWTFPLSQAIPSSKDRLADHTCVPTPLSSFRLLFLVCQREPGKSSSEKSELCSLSSSSLCHGRRAGGWCAPHFSFRGRGWVEGKNRTRLRGEVDVWSSVCAYPAFITRLLSNHGTRPEM